MSNEVTKTEIAQAEYASIYTLAEMFNFHKAKLVNKEELPAKITTMMSDILKEAVIVEEECDTIIDVQCRFIAEHGWNIQRVGLVKAVTEWLQGLAIDVPYWNCDILDLAVKYGAIDKEAPEQQEDAFLENYWKYLAIILIG